MKHVGDTKNDFINDVWTATQGEIPAEVDKSECENYINNSDDEALIKTYIKSIEDILSYKEKQVENYINSSSTTY